jgi:hypothetical protein
MEHVHWLVVADDSLAFLLKAFAFFAVAASAKGVADGARSRSPYAHRSIIRIFAYTASVLAAGLITGIVSLCGPRDFYCRSGQGDTLHAEVLVFLLAAAVLGIEFSIWSQSRRER